MNDKVRILYAHRWGKVMGGGEIWLHTLATYLDRDLFAPDVVLPYDGALSTALTTQHIPVHFLPIDHMQVRPIKHAPRSIWRVIKAGLDLSTIAHTMNAHLIHAFCLEALQSSLIAARLVNIPTVVSVLNSGPFTREDKACFKAVDSIIVNARSIQSDIQEAGITNKQIHIIFLGMDVNRFSQQSDSDVRKEFGFAQDTPVIGMVGNIEQRKGYDILIRALPGVIKEFPAVKVLAVGAEKSHDGQELQRLKALADELGIAQHIIFTGARRDIPELLGTMDIFVLCSRREGLSLAMTEAMAAGKPVVVTPVGGMAEAIEPGRNGFLVPPEDPDALAEKLCHLLANPDTARRMGQTGREMARQRFDNRMLVRQTEAVYRNVCAGQRSRPVLWPLYR